MALIEVRGLTFRYPEREQPALDGVSLSVERGAFVVLCGKSGCGKSTLLRHLRTALTPHGERSGEVRFDGRPLDGVGLREQAARIGFVQQSPDNQIVTDKVWHELAFGLESLGEPAPAIRRRVAEMASFFGIQEWYEKSVAELSGGQKQILALASVMAMQPDVLVLDEPTAQLDPIAAEDFIGTLAKIHDEIGTTVVLSEHRLEAALPRAGQAVVMSRGRVVCAGAPSGVGRRLHALGDPMLAAMPTPARVFFAAAEKKLDSATAAAGGLAQNDNGSIPLTVREGREWLGARAAECRPYNSQDPIGHETSVGAAFCRPQKTSAPPVVSLKDVWFRYDRAGRDVVRDLSLTLAAGEFLCVVGGNGTGKSTMLRILTGENRVWRGKVRVFVADPQKAGARGLAEAGLSALPQDPQTLFTRPTVFDNLIDVAAYHNKKAAPEEIEAEVRRVCALTEIEDLLAFHPYDVSGGEQQRIGLAMALLARPKILLLDEPTKGMDSFFKEKFSRILRRLTADGASVLMVSHDVEFCARHADRCALFFNGSVVSEGAPREFFSGNSFYTTAASRMSRGLIDGAVTAEDILDNLFAVATPSDTF
ncbi:MAG: ATP-binding cassette domain-containing protein [Clostridiales Family XIII bacterium]|jgi:energy-coupling factor transport system ATP-binding protein|nr:ATP-binding cassette domain-containing protein [Clostridiales Family XIII bacterium]